MSMAVSGSVMATLSSIAVFGSSCGAQQLGAQPLGAQHLGALRSPATSWNGSRVVVIKASRTSEGHVVRSKALVALVAAGAALVLNVTPTPPSAAALDLSSLIDNVKDLANNISSEEGESTAAQLAKQAAQQAARDFASGDADTKSNKILDTIKKLAGNVPNLEGNEEAKNAAIDIAKNAAQGAQDSNNGNTAGQIFDAVKTLSGKIPGFDGEKLVQNATTDVAKGAASDAARGFVDNAKNRIGMEAGKALLNKFTGGNNDE